MNPCAREIEWAGGKHTFCLNEPKVLAVMAGASGAPRCARVKSGVLELPTIVPAACFKRFQDDAYTVADIEHVILYGLWGGGLPLSAADELVAQHVRGQPLGASAMVAFEVIAALFIGAADAGASA